MRAVLLPPLRVDGSAVALVCAVIWSALCSWAASVGVAAGLGSRLEALDGAPVAFLAPGAPVVNVFVTRER